MLYISAVDCCVFSKDKDLFLSEPTEIVLIRPLALACGGLSALLSQVRHQHVSFASSGDGVKAVLAVQHKYNACKFVHLGITIMSTCTHGTQVVSRIDLACSAFTSEWKQLCCSCIIRRTVPLVNATTTAVSYLQVLVNHGSDPTMLLWRRQVQSIFQHVSLLSHHQGDP